MSTPQVPVPTAERNAEIRRLRALPPDERPSLAELALKHGISRERVRQIEAREHHPEPGDLKYPGGVLLRRVSEGMFDCFLVPKYLKDARRIGVVTKSRDGWELQRAGSEPVTAETLPSIAKEISDQAGKGEWQFPTTVRTDRRLHSASAA